jgi:hypothetical protein
VAQTSYVPIKQFLIQKKVAWSWCTTRSLYP